jgi:anti-anti-sigma factor
VPVSNEALVIERFDGAVHGQRVLCLVGPLTMATASPLQTAVRSENASTLILDLARVPYMDSVGLGSLVGAYVGCQKAGRRIALSGANARVLHLFEVTRLEPFFLLFPTASDAVEALAHAASA